MPELTRPARNRKGDVTPPRAGKPGEVRRIFRLFAEHKSRLLFVAVLIIASSLISVASPFLLREVLDVSLPTRNTALTAMLAGGMVLIAVGTTVLDVIQSRQSTLVGQSVMHRLRTSVYSHLQRLSLGFYTRTRTGEIQSRIAGDIGSMQATVTSTVTSVVSSGTTVIATLVAMLALDWKLTLVSLVLVPIFVLISRKVGGMRRQIATIRQERMADLSSQVSESLSVSGILLTKTMGRSNALGDKFAETSADLADLEVRSSMTGRWRQSSIGIIVSILPAAIYLAAAISISGDTGPVSIGTLVAFTALQGALFRPMVSLLRTGVDMQTSMAMFRRVFDYLDLPVEIDEPVNARELPDGRGELRFDDVTFSYPGSDDADAVAHRPDHPGRQPCRRGRARPGPARPPLATWPPGCTTRPAGPCCSTAWISGSWVCRTSRPWSASSPRRPTCCMRPSRTICASPGRMPAMTTSRRPPGPRRSTS